MEFPHPMDLAREAREQAKVAEIAEDCRRSFCEGFVRSSYARLFEAYTNLVNVQATPAPVERTLELDMVIGDTLYEASVDFRTGAVTLNGPDSEWHVETRSTSGRALQRPSVNRGHLCDCPDFHFRHATGEGEGCKHVKAVASNRRITRFLQSDQGTTTLTTVESDRQLALANSRL